MGKYGMAVYNVRSVELVDANGQIRTADAEQNPDLYWALRGGGGNFGVAASFEYDAHPVSMIYGGLIAFALPDAPKVWEFLGDFAAESPDELVLMMALVHAPDGSGHKIAAVAMCHCGDLAKGEEAAAAIRGAATPLMDMLGPLPYPVQNTLLDPGFPKGARNYWKSAYFKEITADTVAVMVARFAQTPSIMTAMVIEHFHGAVTRVPPTATAFPHRKPGYNLVIPGVWPDARDDDANIAWVKDTFGALAPYTTDSVYVNSWPTTTPRGCRPRMGPAGIGCNRSSARTTPRTSSTSTKTSRRHSRTSISTVAYADVTCRIREPPGSLNSS